MNVGPNQPDRVNYREPFGFRGSFREPGVDGFTAAVDHPERYAELSLC